MNKFNLILIASLFFSWHGFGQTNNNTQAIEQAKKKYQLSVKLNDFSEAKSALYDLIVLEPNNHSYLDSLAYMYFDFGQNASAALASQEALKFNGQNQALLQIGAQSFKKLGVLDRSLQLYQRLYNVSDDIFTLYEVASLQLQLKKYDEAMINTELLLGKPLIDNKVNVRDKDGNEIHSSPR